MKNVHKYKVIQKVLAMRLNYFFVQVSAPFWSFYFFGKYYYYY